MLRGKLEFDNAVPLARLPEEAPLAPQRLKLDVTTIAPIHGGRVYPWADFAKFVVAAEPVLPWRPGAFLAAYRRSRLDANGALADGDTVANAVRAFMGPARSEWSGLMSDLYQELSNPRHFGQQQPADWPGNARWFGDRLRRSAPVLRTLGVDFRERRGATGVGVTLSRIATFTAPATSSLETPHAPNSDASATSAATDPLSALHLSRAEASVQRRSDMAGALNACTNNVLESST